MSFFRAHKIFDRQRHAYIAAQAETLREAKTHVYKNISDLLSTWGCPAQRVQISYYFRFMPTRFHLVFCRKV